VLSVTLLAIALMISATKVNAMLTVLILTIMAIACAAFCVFAAIQTVTDRQNERVIHQLNEMIVGLRNSDRLDAERHRAAEQDRIRAEQDRTTEQDRIRAEQERLRTEQEDQLAQALALARENNLNRRPPRTTNEHTELLRQAAQELQGMSWADLAEMDDRVANPNMTG
jgi:beta-phosphoglucomutase-like phosphatase (HAD superfamily)